MAHIEMRLARGIDKWTAEVQRRPKRHAGIARRRRERLVDVIPIVRQANKVALGRT
jgi:hypothetical protein